MFLFFSQHTHFVDEEATALTLFDWMDGWMDEESWRRIWGGPASSGRDACVAAAVEGHTDVRVVYSSSWLGTIRYA